MWYILRCILEHSFIFGKKLLWFYKMFSETTCSSFWWTTYLLSFDGRVFQQTVGIAKGTTCAPLLAYLLFFFVWGSHHTGAYQEKRTEATSILNFTFHYIDDVRSLNNSRFGEFVDRLYPIELEINDTTYTDRSASYLDLHLNIDNNGRLRTDTLQHKRWFQFSHWELSIYM